MTDNVIMKEDETDELILNSLRCVEAAIVNSGENIMHGINELTSTVVAIDVGESQRAASAVSIHPASDVYNQRESAANTGARDDNSLKKVNAMPGAFFPCVIRLA